MGVICPPVGIGFINILKPVQYLRSVSSEIILVETSPHIPKHTTYRNNLGQKCEGNCGLLVLIEIIKRMYPENLKKIVGAVWELPAR